MLDDSYMIRFQLDMPDAKIWFRNIVTNNEYRAEIFNISELEIRLKKNNDLSIISYPSINNQGGEMYIDMFNSSRIENSYPMILLHFEKIHIYEE